MMSPSMVIEIFGLEVVYTCFLSNKMRQKLLVAGALPVYPGPHWGVYSTAPPQEPHPAVGLV